LKTYKNILAISLAIILVIYYLIFGNEYFWKVILSHFMFLAIIPMLIFLQAFAKNIPIKNNISIQTICQIVLKKKCDFDKRTLLALLLFLLGTDYLFDGVYGLIDGLLTWWSFAAGAWLVLLTAYSYQVYINPSEKNKEDNEITT